MFIQPADGVITSHFRMKSRPNHHGLDIAKKGQVPIKAAASGTVTKSYYSSSYGNVVFIVHHINGQTYETVYAHMRNRLVKEKEKVSQGQIIGYMGNTGHSTGQHLHFEIHKGRWNMAKSNAVDPLKFLVKKGTSIQPIKKQYNLSAIVPYPGKPIKLGSRGKDVERIQRAVNVTPDGIFGPITEKAVKEYQKRHGLHADGIVGPITWGVMF